MLHVHKLAKGQSLWKHGRDRKGLRGSSPDQSAAGKINAGKIDAGKINAGKITQARLTQAECFMINPCGSGVTCCIHTSMHSFSYDGD